jgi:flagellar protein FliL
MAQKKKPEVLDAAPAPASNTKLIIIMGSAMLLVVLIAVGVTVWLLGGKESSSASQEPAIRSPLYLSLDKFTSNFPAGSGARFLQVDIQLMSYSQAVLDKVDDHMPVIRNDILVLLGGVTFEQVNTLEGKEALRQKLLESIRATLLNSAGVEGLEQVYFTHFVMQ